MDTAPLLDVSADLLVAIEQAWQQRIEAPAAAQAALQDLHAEALATANTTAAARARVGLLLLALRAGTQSGDPFAELEAIDAQCAQAHDALGHQRLNIIRALMLGEQGRREAAIDLLAEGKNAALAELPPGDALLYLNLLGNYLLEAGQISAALGIWYEGLERARAYDQPAETVMVELNLAVLHLRYCDFGSAALLLEAAWSRMKTQGLTAYRLVCAGNLATTWLLQDRPEDAARLLREMLDEVPAAFDAFDRQFFEIMLVQTDLRCGRVQEARARLDLCRARQVAQQLDAQLGAPLTLANCECLLAEGRLEAAQAEFARLAPLEDASQSVDPASNYERLGLELRLHEAQGNLRAAWLTSRQRQEGLVRALRELRAAEHLGRQVRYQCFRTELEQRMLRDSRVRSEGALARITDAHRELGARLTALEGLQMRLKEMALRDPLTGLYRRRVLADLLPREIATARDQSRPLSIALIDVDQLSRINQEHGFAAGDELLRELAHIIRILAPSPALGLRYADEEFCLLLPGVDGAGAAQLLARMQNEFQRRSSIRANSANDGVSFSAGIAELAVKDGVDSIIGRADLAQYRAKLRGRAQLVVAGGTG
ncbi:GGDEF domain-containing protein [Niveibacterium sp. SC-1]|uniref:GGDEF domain-containing protein n=1 Tax=Niveibacterium sp. SC-1 TaxID=3135646 RepID=UPI00311E4921